MNYNHSVSTRYFFVFHDDCQVLSHSFSIFSLNFLSFFSSYIIYPPPLPLLLFLIFPLMLSFSFSHIFYPWHCLLRPVTQTTKLPTLSFFFPLTTPELFSFLLYIFNLLTHSLFPIVSMFLTHSPLLTLSLSPLSPQSFLPSYFLIVSTNLSSHFLLPTLSFILFFPHFSILTPPFPHSFSPSYFHYFYFFLTIYTFPLLILPFPLLPYLHISPTQTPLLAHYLTLLSFILIVSNFFPLFFSFLYTGHDNCDT